MGGGGGGGGVAEGGGDDETNPVDSRPPLNISKRTLVASHFINNVTAGGFMLHCLSTDKHITPFPLKGK